MKGPSPSATSEATVGFQGERGAFSEGAARALAPGLRPEPRPSFVDVVHAVETGRDRAGILPVENTLAGGVTAAFDALIDGKVKAVAEAALPIRHALLGVPGATRSGIREVRSHPVALAQCRRFFEQNPGIRAAAVHDTAGAAREVAEAGDPTIAALAGRHAAPAYQLEVLADDLQDRDDNQTRFLLIVDRDEETAGAPWVSVPPESAAWKTGLSVDVQNRPGALRDLLTVFADRGRDLTFIASRPTGTPWTYRFLMEFRHETVEEGQACVAATAEAARQVQVLGTYRAVDIQAPALDRSVSPP
ncbi:MAG: prephenate dehydratase domain-containing protein [Longimicrobiales bacterium]|nr:prephenate dehydratase domain-containing protein [Longimicrobiales bacterium]